MHHVLNDHDWILGKCEHEPLTGPATDENGVEITNFNQQEPAFQVLRKIVIVENFKCLYKVQVSSKSLNAMNYFNFCIL